MKKILIITNKIDLTSDYLIDKFSDKFNFFRFNTDRFFDYNIEITPSGTYIDTQKETFL
ncbi:hypothetical protein NCCP28_42940 [Niallia sp. NCCP-28]|nr:hypothetical protein NCCP28_42940 [Niallia sp. NCCP-28]